MRAHRRDWIEANGICLRYDLSGGGPSTVVLVHEMGGGIEAWDEVAAGLEADCRVLRYDQRGFGLSEKHTDLSLDTAVDDLASLLDALAITAPVVLAGAALGAAVCLAFTLRHPHRVQGQVLSSPATGGLSAAALQALEARLARVRQGGLRAVVDSMLAVTYPLAMRGDAGRFERCRLRWLTMDPAPFIALNQMMARFDLRPQLPRVTTPTLVIGCTHDTVRPAARSAELAALMPGARYVEAASGHFMPVQTPDLFATQVHAFLTRLPPTVRPD